MPKIHFFTPIHYGSQANTAEEKAIQDIDNYFHMGGKKAVVIGKASNGNEIVRMTKSKISAQTVFKTIGIALSFATVVIPAVMLIAKAALRSSHKYVIEKGDNSDNNSKITSVKNRQQSRHEKKAQASIKPSQEQATSKPPKVEDTQKSAQEKTAMKSFSGLDIVTKHSQARKNHLAWLRGGYLDMLKTSGKSIPVFNASELNQERFQQLSKVVENELVKINKTGVNDFVSRMGGYVIYTPPKDFLKDPSEHAAKKLSSEIVTKILSNLDIILKSKQNKPSESDPSEVDTLHLRTLEIRRPDLFKGVKKFIEKSDEIKPKHLEHGDANDLAEQLSYVLLKELERGEEICYYHSGEDTGGHNLSLS